MARKLVIWPSYIDSEKTRRMGRKIAKNKAVPSPKLREIAAAAEALGLGPVVEGEKAYPREWWTKGGRVLVRRGSYKTKTDILEAIAEVIARKRSS